MKLAFIIPIILFVPGCNSTHKSDKFEDSSDSNMTRVSSGEDTLTLIDSSKNEPEDKIITVTVSYAAIACGCAQWFETKYKGVKFLDGIERFYLEPTSKDLANANDLWDGEHLPLTLEITGRFSKEKGLPVTYLTKGEPEKARIFWYDKISVIRSTQKLR
jgi:hypothetical protein